MSTQLTRRQVLRGMAGTGVVALLSACQPASVKQTGTTPQAAAKTPVQVATPAPKELKGEVITVFKGGAWEDDYWAPKAKLFNEVYPNIKMVSISGLDDNQFIQKISTMVASGEPPDMARCPEARMQTLAPKGVWEDLGPRIDVSGALQKTFPQISKELTKTHRFPVGHGGKLFSMPYGNVICLWFYNKDLFEKMGVTPPGLDWTWDDLVTIGLKMTNAKENQYLYQQGVVSFQESHWMWQAGGTLFSPDCLRVNLDQEPNIKAMEFVADLFVKHKVVPSPELKLGEIGVSFDTGKLAMSLTHTTQLPVQLGPKPTWNFKWSATYAPKGPAVQTDYYKAEGLALGKGAKNIELGWTYINWHMSEAQQIKFSEGGELSVCSDILKNVSLKHIPEHLGPALERSVTHGRGLEMCPGWNVTQKAWKEEMAAVWLGRLSAKEGMLNAQKKGQPELETVMKELGFMK